MRHNRHLLISADALAAQLDSVVVIHVGRTDSAYRAWHIPGARFLPLSAVAVTVGGLTNEFPTRAELERSFGALGVGSSGRVVLYGDDPGLLAARAWVALDLLGLGDRAALLDGGLTAWRAGSRAIETEVRPFRSQRLSASWLGGRKLVDAAWVRAHLGDSTVLFVDARPADQFGGAEPPCPPNQPACVQLPEERRGHLPGAVSLFWMNALVSRQEPVLKPMHALHHALWEPAGADRPHLRTIVLYCRTGVQASHGYFVARYIGYPDVRLYDGSFAEWAALAPDRHPVERGTPAGR